jgi:acid phosphatase
MNLKSILHHRGNGLRLAAWAVLGLLACLFVGIVLFVWLGTPRGKSGGIEMSWPPHDAADGTVRLLAVGDTGTAGTEQFHVAAAMETVCNRGKDKPFDGILLLGDNFYPAGVASTTDPQWREKFEKPYGLPCLSSLPVYPVLGNHDYRLSPQSQIDYFAVQPRWRMPGRFYSVDFGPVARLVALDTNRFDWCGSPANCVFDFMKSRLDSARGAWTIVTGHHPMGSSSAHGSAYDGTFFAHTVRPSVCERADFYLAGHSHHLEHLRFDQCKTDFVVAGSGGADLGRLRERESESKFAKSTHGFVALEFTGASAKVVFYDSSEPGVPEIYRFEKVRKP